jgi:hypothetical protein
MSRLAYHLNFSLLVVRKAFPDNPAWEIEVRIAAMHLIAGTDDAYFDMVERELFGEG